MGKKIETMPKLGIWVTWESHRRSQELARSLGTELYELLSERPYFIRAIVLSWRTLRVLMHSRPKVLVVQNPSILLAALTAALKPLLSFYLVVDRHSNFKLHTLKSRSPRYRIFHALSAYSIRQADLTIVTNDALCCLVEETGGRGYVLPDRFPDLPLAEVREMEHGHHVLYVCSFDDDEPIGVVIEAAKLLGQDWKFHITGNFRKPGWRNVVECAPENVHFLGFVSEQDYQSMLVSCDIVLTLTTMPHIMQCGAYEAVAATKPLVFGPDPAMKSYFSKGCLSTELNPEAVAGTISEAVAELERLTLEVRDLKRERGLQWLKMRDELVAQLPFDSKDSS